MSERYELETRLGAYRPWANDTDWERKRGYDMWGKAVKTTINPHLPHLSGSHSQFGKNKLFSEMTTATMTHRGMLLLLCK